MENNTTGNNELKQAKDKEKHKEKQISKMALNIRMQLVLFEIQNYMHCIVVYLLITLYSQPH